jgi:hypothetical protein
MRARRGSDHGVGVLFAQRAYAQLHRLRRDQSIRRLSTHPGHALRLRSLPGLPKQTRARAVQLERRIQDC